MIGELVPDASTPARGKRLSDKRSLLTGVRVAGACRARYP